MAAFPAIMSWRTWYSRLPPIAAPPSRRRQRAVALHLEPLEDRRTPSVSVVPQQFETNQYTALSISENQLLAGATGSGELEVGSPTQPAHAALVDNHNGTFTFTPANDFSGTTTFQYTVGDAGQILRPTPSDNPGFTFSPTQVAIDGDTAVLSAASEAYVFGARVEPGARKLCSPLLKGTASVRWRSAVIRSSLECLTGKTRTSCRCPGRHSCLCVPKMAGASRPCSQLPAAAERSVRRRRGSQWRHGGRRPVGDFSGPGPPKGASHVFVRSQGTWSQQAVLTAPDNTTDGRTYTFGFGQPSVAISGDTVVVAAQVRLSGSISAGEGVALVFVRSGESWSRQAILARQSFFESPLGGRVAVSGDTAVVGSRLFVRTGNTWQQTELKTVDDIRPAPGEFITLLAANSDRAVALSGTFSGTFFRSLIVFEQANGTWTQKEKLEIPIDNTGGFDTPVAFSGETILIGGQPYGPFGPVGASPTFATWDRRPPRPRSKSTLPARH